MTSNLRRIISLVLSFIMIMSCLFVINTTSVSAYTPEVLYKHYGYAADATANGDDISNNAKTVFTNASVSIYDFTPGTYTLNDKEYTLKRAASTTSLTIVVPEGVPDATLSMAIKSINSNARTLTLSKNGTAVGSSKSVAGATVVTYKGLSSGTYTLKSSDTIYYSLLTLKLSATYVVSGKVTDNKGNAVKCATVEVNGMIASTNGSGEYSINAVYGENDFKVTALGHSSHTENIFVTEDTTKDVVLHKKVDKIYKFYGNETDATNNYDSADDNARTIFTDINPGTGGNYTTNLNIGGSTYNFTHIGNRNDNRKFTIVVPEGVENANLYLAYRSLESYSNANLTLSKNGNTIDNTKYIPPKVGASVSYTDLSAGTYTVTTTAYSIYPLLFVLTTSPIYTISGKVTDEMGEPVKCATVYVGDDIELITDGDGNYSVDVSEGTVINSVKATAIGYEDYDKTVAITDDTTYDITLKRKSVVYKFFANATDATNNYDSVDNNDTNVFSASTGAATIQTGMYNICGSSYNLSLANGGYSGFDIVVPSGMENADFYMVAAATRYGTSQLTLTKGDDVIDEQQYLDKDETPVIVKYSGLSEGKYTLKGSEYFKYSFMALVSSDLPITETNITDCVTAIDNGLVSNISTDSPFADKIADLNETDRIFTLVGMVNGEHKDSDFMNKIDKVGFALYDADVVDSLGENAKTMNPILLKKKYSSADFGDETTATDEVYKNFYDVDKYDKDLDSELGYTGATSLEESSNKSYFAYVVALGQGKRYYVYPYTLYTGESQNVFDGTSEDKIEISNN